jgi:hypothetical protein
MSGRENMVSTRKVGYLIERECIGKLVRAKVYTLDIPWTFTDASLTDEVWHRYRPCGSNINFIATPRWGLGS